MSGQWEKYVEPALLALWRERFGPSTPVHEFGPEMQECVRDEVRAVLASVGPLIAGDTRERMVAAAARAVERPAPSGCAAPHPMASHILCVKPPNHEGDHVSKNGRNWRRRPADV